MANEVEVQANAFNKVEKFNIDLFRKLGDLVREALVSSARRSARTHVLHVWTPERIPSRYTNAISPLSVTLFRYVVCLHRVSLELLPPSNMEALEWMLLQVRVCVSQRERERGRVCMLCAFLFTKANSV